VSKTYSEIRQQPAVWKSVLATASSQWASIAEHVTVSEDTQLLFVGSGTSFYLAQAAAHAAQELTGRTSHAVPSADVFLSPASSVPDRVPLLAFLISRSGRTSEALLAAELLRSQRAQATVVALSCVADSPLAARAHHAIALEEVHEESIVMTQSFTSILLALQIVAATIAADETLQEQLHGLPGWAASGMRDSEVFARRLGEDRTLSDFVYLGVGSYFGLAQEATLKLTEMTQTRCAAYNSLEFRHGPISTVKRGTVVVLLGAQRDSAYIDALVRDLAGYGAFVAAIAPPGVGAGADQTLPMPGELDDLARSLLYMPALQLIAYHRAAALGLDPDAPRNLGHVVVLDHEAADAA
jgi:glucosamine--fructose-6-phosphate aminotransferase (isomerizing)